MIEANSVKQVPLFIEAQGLEELSVTAYFIIVGSQEAPLVSQWNQCNRFSLTQAGSNASNNLMAIGKGQPSPCIHP